MQFDAFLGPTSGNIRHSTWNAEITRNLIMQVLRRPSRGRPGQWRLKGTPGLTLFSDTGGGMPVDLWAKNDRMFTASREWLHEVFEDGSVIIRGALAGDNRRAGFATNGDLANQLLVCAGGRGDVLDLSTNVVTQITDAAFPAGARSPLYIDGYFIVVSENTLQFNLSDLLAGLSWSTLDAGEKSQTPDRLKAAIDDGTLLWLFGTDRIEVWYNSGNPSFPWDPIDNLVIRQGIRAPDTLVNLGTPAWIGGNEHGGISAFVANGYTPEAVSTPEIEEEWEGYDTVENAFAWVYTMHQQTFWVITFPAADKTWVYNRDTGLWHEWSFRDEAQGLDRAHIGRSHAYCWGRHFVSDRRSGAIYVMSDTAYTDAGTAITRVRQAPHISAEDFLLICSRFALDIQTGDAPLNGTGSDPQVALTYSDDASRTWSTPLYVPLGRRGDYGRLVEFFRLGAFEKGRTFRVTITDPQFIGIAGAYLDLERA